MATYVQPTLAEFQAVLVDRGFKPLTLPGTLELVFGKRVDKDNRPLSLRVYTSLNPNGLGRACGEDAIRVEVYFKTTEGKVKRVGGSRRVNRVPGWADRLVERVDRWEEALGPDCPACGCPTVERTGSWGTFFGCCQYPACRGTVKAPAKAPGKPKAASKAPGASKTTSGGKAPSWASQWTLDEAAEALSISNALSSKLWRLLQEIPKAKRSKLGGDGTDGTVEVPGERFPLGADKLSRHWSKLAKDEQEALTRAWVKDYGPRPGVPQDEVDFHLGTN